MVEKFAEWVETAYSGYHRATQLNHYVDFAGKGFESGFIPAEASVESSALYSNHLSSHTSDRGDVSEQQETAIK
jgi:hypothetical protein